MNPLHGPSLELCKKLKEVGFNQKIKLKWYQGFGKLHLGKSPNKYDTIVCSCPSVMEMLDVMPIQINLFEDENEVYGLEMHPRDFGENLYDVCYFHNGSGKYERDTLPNALAEMILWLVENKHLTFK